VLALSAHLLDQRPASISEASFEPDLAAASDMLQDMEAFGFSAHIFAV